MCNRIKFLEGHSKIFFEFNKHSALLTINHKPEALSTHEHQGDRKSRSLYKNLMCNKIIAEDFEPPVSN
jgi:hypothetical protein